MNCCKLGDSGETPNIPATVSLNLRAVVNDLAHVSLAIQVNLWLAEVAGHFLQKFFSAIC